MITPVILSGGTGSRLWPLSRTDSPKQFLKLHGEHPMIVETALRTQGPLFLPPIIVAGEAHRFHVAACMQDADVELSAIILEPAARSTAPAIALAAHFALQSNKDAIILCCPADHVIENEPDFIDFIELALPAAKKGHLVTFGINPTSPETGFGYIRKGQKAVSTGVFTVDEFFEKPELSKATSFLEAGDYLWNSGIFLMRADAYLEELKKFQPDIFLASAKSIDSARPDMDFIRPDDVEFCQSPNLSIDYAVMEKTSKAAIVPVSLNWSDIGSWDALYSLGTADMNGVVKTGDVLTQDVKNSYIHAGSRLVACIGVEDIAIIETADAVLIAARDQTQNVRHLFDQLKTEGRREAVHHSYVERPWGSFETLALGDRFQVKRIIVKPGGILSLQKHHHRAEHWVVVEGTARVTVGEKVCLLSENQSTYIPLGEIHRLENPGKVAAVMIEVQTGAYLGEDDIVRLEDLYNREAIPASAKTS